MYDAVGAAEQERPGAGVRQVRAGGGTCIDGGRTMLHNLVLMRGVVAVLPGMEARRGGGAGQRQGVGPGAEALGGKATVATPGACRPSAVPMPKTP